MDSDGPPFVPQGDDAAPPAIAASGWWKVLRGAASRASRHHLLHESGGVAFFALLGMLPALTALISFYGLFADTERIAHHLAQFAAVAPDDVLAAIGDQARSIAASDRGTLGFGATLGLLAGLWSANRATRALLRAVNLVRGGQETRRFWARTTLAFAFTLGGILFAVLAIGVVVALPAVLRLLGFGGTGELALRLMGWPVLLGAAGLFLACLYRYAPCGPDRRWRWVTRGSAFAVLAWLLGSVAYSWYVDTFGSRGGAYGPIGVVVGFMTWLWLSFAIVLAGAALNAEIECEAGPRRFS